MKHVITATGRWVLMAEPMRDRIFIEWFWRRGGTGRSFPWWPWWRKAGVPLLRCAAVSRQKHRVTRHASTDERRRRRDGWRPELDGRAEFVRENAASLLGQRDEQIVRMRQVIRMLEGKRRALSVRLGRVLGLARAARTVLIQHGLGSAQLRVQLEALDPDEQRRAWGNPRVRAGLEPPRRRSA